MTTMPSCPTHMRSRAAGHVVRCRRELRLWEKNIRRCAPPPPRQAAIRVSCAGKLSNCLSVTTDISPSPSKAMSSAARRETSGCMSTARPWPSREMGDALPVRSDCPWRPMLGSIAAGVVPMDRLSSRFTARRLGVVLRSSRSSAEFPERTKAIDTSGQPFRRS